MARVAIVSDAQSPYQDDAKVAAACELIAAYKPDHLVMNGDLLDCDGISRYGSECEHDILDELETAAAILYRLRLAAPSAKRYYLEGNHEYRMERENGQVPKFVRAAVAQARDACSEFGQWRRRPYRFNRKHVLKFGPILVHHGKATGATSDELEAFTIAELCGGKYDNRLVVRGHTHVPIPPRQCKRTARIPVSLWYANTGTLCDPSRMRWTETLETWRWGAGVGLFEWHGGEWAGTVEIVDG